MSIRSNLKIDIMLSIEDLKKLHDEAKAVAVDRSTAEPAECIFIHRTAVIMADGEVVTCANMYAENVGHLKKDVNFSSLWNNDRMQSVRGTLNTEKEWEQCKKCWFREIRYAEQRNIWANFGGERTQASLAKKVEYQPIAWDFIKEQRERNKNE